MNQEHTPESGAPVTLLGGPFDRQRVLLSATPPRVNVGGLIYEQVTDPDSGAFLGAYVLPPGVDQ